VALDRDVSVLGRGDRDGPKEVSVINRLKVLRAERSWSQGDLAERLGVSRQTVNAIETGKYDPSLPLAFAIARLFEMPIESIFDPAARMPAAKAPAVKPPAKADSE
jgi:putative transcriptional regulator